MYNTIIHYNNEEEYKKCILNIDKFLENVSCNVRSSINNINGAADLSLMTNVNTEQKQYLNLIKSNTLNVLNVLNAAIDFLKIQFCNMKVEKVEFNFKDFIDDVVKLSSKEAIYNDVKFEIDIDEGIPNVLIGDIVKLRQVLIGIIEGIIKFTKHGMVSFMIEVINSSQEQIDLRFKVKTSSTAFRKNDVLKFFENLNKSNGKYCIKNLNGSMIGLYIASEIVKVMGSQMNVVSKKNIGTAFSFDLSLEISKKSSLIDIDVDNKIEDKILTRKLNFLIAGEDKLSGDILYKLLQKHGHICTLIDDKNDVLNEVQNKKHDIILMGMQTQLMNDVQLVKSVRKIEKKKGTYTPIIAVVTYEPKCDKQKFFDAGVDKYISKPFEINELIKAAYSIVKNDRKSLQPIIKNNTIYEDSLFLYPL